MTNERRKKIEEHYRNASPEGKREILRVFRAGKPKKEEREFLDRLESGKAEAPAGVKIGASTRRPAAKKKTATKTAVKKTIGYSAKI